MAKAKYKRIKYTGTYKCGHEATIYVGGYSDEYRDKEAEERFKGLCPDCLKEERQKQYVREAEEARKEAEELGLPELEGSKKQITWALNIRKNLMSRLSEDIDNLSDNKVKRLISKDEDWIVDKEAEDKIIEAKINMQKALENFLYDTKSAAKYIDLRDTDLISLISDHKRSNKEKELEEERLKEIDEEKEIIPENYCGFDIRIWTDDYINLDYTGDKDITEIAESLNYKWSPDSWYKKITDYMGSLDDIIAGTGNKFLLAGFGVKFDIDNYEEIERKAISGDYKEEIVNIIDYLPKKSKFYIFWGNEVFLDEALRISGAVRSKQTGYVYVPISSYEEILDFAEVNNFKITDLALEKIRSREEKIKDQKVEITEKEVKEVEKTLTTLDDEIPNDLLD